MTSQTKQSKTARFTAIETLGTVYQSRLAVKPIFDQLVNRYSLPPKERKLAMQLVYGVLRHRQTLDRILELLSRTPLKKIDLFIHQTLAVGLYQLFFLERIPESAVVNEAVMCCKVARIPQRLHGFVNGILRQAVRQKEDLRRRSLTDREQEPILNHPKWLAKKWIQGFGKEETERICRANNCEPTLVLRINNATITREGFCRILEEAKIPYQPGNYSKEAVILPEYRGPIKGIPGYDEGFFQVQDEAAQLATLLLGPFEKGFQYLDGCAGLGGKTSHLVQLAKEYELRVHAVEPEPHRFGKLKENLSRLFPKENTAIHQTDLHHFSELHKDILFDGILIDAPCSGTGVIGRHPDIRWNRLPEELQRYQDEQLALLSISARHLRPGGILVYATCSLEPEENQQVVDLFLAKHTSFILTDISSCLPRPAHHFIKNNSFMPHPSATIDGFFAVRMQCT